MTRDPRFDVLFESVQIGPVTAKNRFYQVPALLWNGVQLAAVARQDAGDEGGRWLGPRTRCRTSRPEHAVSSRTNSPGVIGIATD